MHECPSRLVLAQWIAGELGDPQLKAVGKHLDSCPSCQARLKEMQAHQRGYQERAGSTLKSLQERLCHEPVANPKRQRSRTLRAMAVGIPLAIAASLALMLLGPWQRQPPAISYKGTLSLKIVAKRGKRQFEVKAGDLLYESDSLRFALTTATAGYLTIFSVDGRRSLSWFYPAAAPDEQPRPLRTVPKKRHLLPGSIILDDAPGPEHIMVVFSPQAFDRQKLHRRIRQLLSKKSNAKFTAAALGVDGVLKVITINRKKTASR